MKWLYVMILVALVAATMTSEKVRSYLSSSETSAVTSPAGGNPRSSRLDEIDTTSKASRDTTK
ncbi:MAG: hypothetical protein ACR2IE_09410 [Candidatus Sumerlaeaceae bacterium]